MYKFQKLNEDSEKVIEANYDLFARIPMKFGFCRQCFDLTEEDKIRKEHDVRKTPLSTFASIYTEHPGCSGGLGTFLHWLPRGLELAFFKSDFLVDITHQMIRL